MMAESEALPPYFNCALQWTTVPRAGHPLQGNWCVCVCVNEEVYYAAVEMLLATQCDVAHTHTTHTLL